MVQGSGVSVLVFLWYGFSIINNVVSKLAVRAFPHTTTLALVGLATQTLGAHVLVLLDTGLLGSDRKTKKKAKTKTKAPAPSLLTTSLISVPYVAGLLFHRVAIRESSVQFTHTVKSSSVVFTALLSWAILGDRPAPAQGLSLVLVLAGVFSATFTELSFEPLAFRAALVAAASAAAVAVQQKRLLRGGGVNRYKLYASVTLVACIVFVPYWALNGGVSHLRELAAVESPEVLLLVAGSSIGLLGQEFFGYLVLSQVQPLGHALGNSIRSLVVIAASMAYFQSQGTALNSMGIGLALLGGLAYTQSSRIAKPKAE